MVQECPGKHWNVQGTVCLLQTQLFLLWHLVQQRHDVVPLEGPTCAVVEGEKTLGGEVVVDDEVVIEGGSTVAGVVISQRSSTSS